MKKTRKKLTKKKRRVIAEKKAGTNVRTIKKTKTNGGKRY